MPQLYHVGQRLSYGSALCTVRYIGPVQGTSKEWIGVEWDDPERGKHNGEHQGVRYFSCFSKSPTAASFIRPSRVPDPEQTFVEAVHQKYASNTTLQQLPVALNQQIEISGKIVEEVGFEKIRRQLAQLHQLKIVLVDGLRISSAEKPDKTIQKVCPKIVELDLSWNLFEDCGEIVKICGKLDSLRSLRLNGNRLRVLSEDLTAAKESCKDIKELELDEMLLSWEEICLLTQEFQSLTTLAASSNGFKMLPSSLQAPHLTSLTLEYNEFTSLADLSIFSGLSTLEKLYLKGNQISTISPSTSKDSPMFAQSLHYVDLSYNTVSTWTFVDELVDCFPGLTALRFSNNPIYASNSKEKTSVSSFEEQFMLTLARIGRLKTLNFSNILPAERSNAEMFYLSRIGKALAEVPESEENKVLSQHKRFKELCGLYGAPTVVRKQEESVNPAFLEARLIKFTFYLPQNSQTHQQKPITNSREIPKGFDICRVKGIVGRMFGIRPLKMRLIWETGEWDPVAGYEDEIEELSDEEGQKSIDAEAIASREKGKWMKREVEIEDSTRQVGFCVDGNEAKVRIELR